MILKAGSVVRIEDQWEGTVIEGQDGPGSKVTVRLLEGQIVPIDPAVVKIEIIENKEDVAMINTTQTTAPVYTVEEIRYTARSDRMLPEIGETELLAVSSVYRQKLPSGAVVEVQFRKITPTMGVLSVTDDFGVRHFKVMASKREAGTLFTPAKYSREYKKRDGAANEEVVMDLTQRGQAIVLAIAQRIMAVEGITLGDAAGSKALPDLGADIPF